MKQKNKKQQQQEKKQKKVKLKPSELQKAKGGDRLWDAQN